MSKVTRFLSIVINKAIFILETTINKAITILLIVIGVVFYVMFFVIVIAAIFIESSMFIMLLGIILLAVGLLMVIFGNQRKREEKERRRRMFIMTPPASPSPPPLPPPMYRIPLLLISPEVHLATLSFSLPQGDGSLYITSVEQKFGRFDFEGIIPEDWILFINRRHFRIRVRGDKGYLTSEDLEYKRYKIYIEDLGSINGTFVNDVDIRGKGLVPLEKGDRINVAGVIELKVEY